MPIKKNLRATLPQTPADYSHWSGNEIALLKEVLAHDAPTQTESGFMPQHEADHQGLHESSNVQQAPQGVTINNAEHHINQEDFDNDPLIDAFFNVSESTDHFAIEAERQTTPFVSIDTIVTKKALYDSLPQPQTLFSELEKFMYLIDQRQILSSINTLKHNQELKDYFSGAMIFTKHQQSDGTYSDGICIPDFSTILSCFKKSLQTQNIKIALFIWENNLELVEYLSGKRITVKNTTENQTPQDCDNQITFDAMLEIFHDAITSESDIMIRHLWLNNETLKKYLCGEPVFNPENKDRIAVLLEIFKSLLTIKAHSTISLMYQNNPDLWCQFAGTPFAELSPPTKDEVEQELTRLTHNLNQAMQSDHLDLIVAFKEQNPTFVSWFTGYPMTVRIKINDEESKDYTWQITDETLMEHFHRSINSNGICWLITRGRRIEEIISSLSQQEQINLMSNFLKHHKNDTKQIIPNVLALIHDRSVIDTAVAQTGSITNNYLIHALNEYKISQQKERHGAFFSRKRPRSENGTLCWAQNNSAIK